CEAVKKFFKAIVLALEEEIEEESDRDVNEAIGILSSIRKVTFTVHMFILQKVLSIINILTNKLQEKTATLGKASNLIEGIIASFGSLRTSVAFSELWGEISLFLNEHNILIEIPSLVITNFKKRFSSESLMMASSIDHFFNLNFNDSLHFINHYYSLINISKECLNSEMTVAKNVVVQNIGSDVNIDITNVIRVLSENQTVFPNLQKLFTIALTIPISSATCERSFSAMKKKKNWLRTSMLQDRFSNLSILYIEKDMSKNINSNDILNIFADKNRYLLLK
ncbi:zinc finger MYM-type protein 1-like, partial [Aphis craccivora]